MKPILERKRRARINSYLEELKDLIVNECENVTKLEKADVLEVTVRYLKKQMEIHNRASTKSVSDRYREGFVSCAREVSRCLASDPSVDVQLEMKLMNHITAQHHSSTLITLDSPFSAPTSASSLNENGYCFADNYSSSNIITNFWRPW